MFRLFKSLAATAVVFALAGGAIAQQIASVSEFRKPGDLLRYEVVFSGPDAEKIKHVSLYFSKVDGNPPADQVGFRTAFDNGGNVSPTSPKTFKVEFKIPEGIATGDYRLYVNAEADENGGRTQYEAGHQFQLPLVHVRNEKKFVPPNITVSQLQ